MGISLVPYLHPTVAPPTLVPTQAYQSLGDALVQEQSQWEDEGVLTGKDSANEKPWTLFA